jgi:hypothetical protein
VGRSPGHRHDDTAASFEEALESRAASLLELFEQEKSQRAADLISGDTLRTMHVTSEASWLAELENHVRSAMTQHMTEVTRKGANGAAGAAAGRAAAAITPSTGSSITMNRVHRQLGALRAKLDEMAASKGLTSSYAQACTRCTCIACTTLGTAAAGAASGAVAPQRSGFKPLQKVEDHAEVIMKGGFPMTNPKAKRKKAGASKAESNGLQLFGQGSSA